jgi:hypothetical protein
VGKTKRGKGTKIMAVGPAINIAAPLATSAVPEPGTILLFPASWVALLFWKRSQ